MASKIQGITVEIGGDTSGLSKSLKDVNTEIRSTQSELKNVDRLLKLDPTNTELLAQKQQLLATAINDTSGKLDALKKAKAEADKDENVDKNTKAYRDLERQIVETENSLEKLNEEQSKLGNVDLTSLGKKFSEVGNKVTEVGKKLSVVSAGVTAIGAAGVAAAMELDNGYDTIITKTGATGDALNSLTESANNVFNEMPTTMDNVGIAIGEVNTRFGSTGEELETLSKKFIEFSEINGTDLNNSIDMIDKIMTTWNLDMEDTDGILGMLSSTAQATGISTDTLMNSIQENSATFKELGLSVEESVNLMGQFEANGVNSSTALAGLKKSVTNLVAAGVPLENALGNIIDSIKNASSDTEALTIAQETFGTKGAAEMTKAIQEGRINLDELKGSLEDYADVVETTYDETLDPWDELTVATNNLKTAGAELGSSLLEVLQPVIEGVVTKVKEFSNWFRNLDDSSKNIIVTVGILVAAIGPLVTIIGTVISLVGTIITAVSGIPALLATVQGAIAGVNAVLLANPIGIVIAAIVALIAIFVTLYAKCEWFRDGVNNIVNGIVSFVSGAIDTIVNFFTVTIPNAFNTVITFVQTVWSVLSELLTNPIKTALDSLSTLIPKFTSWADSVIKAIKDSFGKIKDVGKNLVTGLWNGIIDMKNWIIEKVKSFASSILDGIKDTLGIHSPSKVTQQYGRYLGEGLAIGFEKSMPEAISDMTQSLADMTDSISSELNVSAPNVNKSVTSQNYYTTKNYQNTTEIIRQPSEVVLQLDKTKFGQVVVPAYQAQMKVLGVSLS